MSMEIRKNYVNPLTMMKTHQKQKLQKAASSSQDHSNRIKELQSKQQQLQNTLLLMKSTGSDSSGISPENQKALEKKLEEVSQELQATKSELPKEEEKKRFSPPFAPKKDFYEKTSSDKL